jgi:hypothetical protein
LLGAKRSETPGDAIRTAAAVVACTPIGNAATGPD